MHRAHHPQTSLLARAWAVDRPLTAVSLLMLVVFTAALAGLVLDPRVIAGAPAWLKPAKFGISVAIFGFTLVWIFNVLPEWTRLRRIVGRTTALVFVVEVGIIALQAWRGTTSHYNLGTPLDAALFSVMGTGIIIQTLVTVALAVALWRQRFEDRAFGWALRLGVTLSLVGSAVGGLMTTPTSAQIANARATHQMPVGGQHTVGGIDGGPGLPGTGWSTEHGDLRVPHFFGLHAMQCLPLLALAFPRRWSHTLRTRAVMAASAGYAAVFAALLTQALHGEPLLHFIQGAQ